MEEQVSIESAIKTLENAIHGLKLELKTWSDPRNFCQRIINEVNQELIEHKQALKIIQENEQ